MSFPADPQAEIPSRYEGLVFDCDGTLVDTMPAHFRAWTELVTAHGLVFPESRFYALAGVPSTEILAILAGEQGVAIDVAALANEKDARYLALPSHGAAIEKVVAIARRERGRRAIAVASGNVTSLVRATLEGARIDSLFAAVVGADLVTRGKPAPDVFLRAAKELGIAPERCVAYEDADLGLRAARAAGMLAIDVRPWISAIDTSPARHTDVTE